VYIQPTNNQTNHNPLRACNQYNTVEEYSLNSVEQIVEPSKKYIKKYKKIEILF